MEENDYKIQYHFVFENDSEKIFDIIIDPKTMFNRLPIPEKKPSWTRLEYRQCQCCPLDKETTPYCPIALNIEELVLEFGEVVSSENCHVHCVTPERTYFKKTYVQEGLFSIFGLINATSRCPVMDFLKPMVRFHLPFATVDETTVRTFSFYLLAQYFEQEKSHVLDINLEKLDEQYEKVQQLNEGILGRIKDVTEKDADRNAFIILNSLAQLISFEIDDSLSSIEALFKKKTRH
ncbi:MAG: hypothetical protein GY859_16850 [Desulfobacterales bacterium]|nr:hypothetical protein [Desulfobacterales bacterium]